MIQNLKKRPENLIEFDFSRFKLPTFVTKCKPLLYREGECYYATLSVEDESGIAGMGTSPEDALIDWNDKICAQLPSSGSIPLTLQRHNRASKSNLKTK